MKKNISTLLRIAVSFGLLGGLFWIMRKDARSILDIIRTSNMLYLAAALFIFVANMSVLAYRMKIVFHGENLAITLWESCQLTLIGYFFNNFMPTAVGGDLFKAHCAATYNKSKVRSYASVLMDRMIGLYSFLIVAGIALLVDKGQFRVAYIRPFVFSFLALGAAVFIMITNKKIADMAERFFMEIKLGKLGEKLDSIYKIVHDYKNRTDVVVKSLIVSIISQSIYFSAIYLLFLSLGGGIAVGNIFLIMPVVTFISMIPSVGGLGVREGALVALFSPVAGREAAFAVSLLLLLGLFIVSLMGGVFYFQWNLSKKNVSAEDSCKP